MEPSFLRVGCFPLMLSATDRTMLSVDVVLTIHKDQNCLLAGISRTGLLSLVSVGHHIWPSFCVPYLGMVVCFIECWERGKRQRHLKLL